MFITISGSIINMNAVAAIDINPYAKDYPEVGVTMIYNKSETYDYVFSRGDALAIMQAAQQGHAPDAAFAVAQPA